MKNRLQMLLDAQKRLLENTEPEVQEAVLAICIIIESLIVDIDKLMENQNDSHEI